MEGQLIPILVQPNSKSLDITLTPYPPEGRTRGTKPFAFVPALLVQRLQHPVQIDGAPPSQQGHTIAAGQDIRARGFMAILKGSKDDLEIIGNVLES